FTAALEPSPLRGFTAALEPSQLLGFTAALERRSAPEGLRPSTPRSECRHVRTLNTSQGLRPHTPRPIRPPMTFADADWRWAADDVRRCRLTADRGRKRPIGCGCGW